MHLALCKYLLLSAVSVGTATASGPPQQPLQSANEEEPFDAAFDRFVEATLQHWHVPGLSIAVVDNEKIFSKGYGFANLPDQKATADTQYFTGSTTKAMTAAAVALLVHDDNYPDVKWTSPINQFIRADFVLEDEHATTHTTIEDALSHRTGLPRHDLIYGQVNDTPSTVAQKMQYLPMTAEPRTMWQYCNIMYGVITDLIETVTGRKLEAVLTDNFWKPLGMSSTSFTIPSTETSDSRLARGYYWDPPGGESSSSTDKSQYVPEAYIDIFPIAGAGATVSTVNDYALWIKALLAAADDGKSNNASSPVTRSIFRDLVTPRAIVSGLDEASDEHEFIKPLLYGLGWIAVQIAGESIVAHSGGLPGFGTELYLLPERGYGLVTMGNTALTSNTAGSAIAAHLLQQKFDLNTMHGASTSSIQKSLGTISKATLHPSASKRQREIPYSKYQTPTARTQFLPLPGSIADFAGPYSHPAYGTVNLTITTSHTASSQKEEILEGLFFPRTFGAKIQLAHVTDTVFKVTVLTPHGLGDVVSGKDIVWEEEDYDFQAVFLLGLDGETVATVGIELEDSMVSSARRKGAKHWQDGMVWFDKM